ncbi:MAG: phytanoyl-CoA dioxygenase family protein [Pseudomonadota bacterium]|nr:phytanoyl-CoA dioxygenase family protein [Pseudomonadota bacterium]
MANASATDLAQHLQRIEVDGFTILPKVIDTELITAIKHELSPFLQGQHPGRNDFEGLYSERVYALLSKAPSIAKIIEHPAVLPILDALLPPGFLLSAALAIHVHPGETPQPMHIDDNAGNLPFPRPRAHFGVSTIWALDDFTTDNGATEVVAGSHRWPEERQAEEDEITQVVMPAGSVIVFLGTLLHRGGANRSTSDRLAITPQYCMPGLRQIENMALAVPPSTAGQYSPRIQEMLGYATIDPGFMGYVDGVHPKRLIDPDYQGRRARGLESPGLATLTQRQQISNP